MIDSFLVSQLVTLVSQKVIKIGLIFVGAWLAKKAVKIIVKKAKLAPQSVGRETSVRQKQRVKTISNLIINSAKIVINFLAFVMILSELGVNITPLLTGAGILGLAVGFGAKSLVSDIIAGFFIIFENQFNVGDKIKAANHEGKVVKITLRTITLRDKDKIRHIIPNSAIKTVTKLPQPKK
ncbi:mechanosensitive ion channel family protein [Patescibacteria group bacterium]